MDNTKKIKNSWWRTFVGVLFSSVIVPILLANVFLGVTAIWFISDCDELGCLGIFILPILFPVYYLFAWSITKIISLFIRRLTKGPESLDRGDRVFIGIFIGFVILLGGWWFIQSEIEEKKMEQLDTCVRGCNVGSPFFNECIEKCE